MQQSVETQPPASPSSFAGLLAALTQPEKKKTPQWSDDRLADDVITLSYERALRAHARYRPADRGDWSFAPDSDQPLDYAEKAPSLTATQTNQDLPTRRSAPQQTVPDQDLRRTSVTIRLSGAESLRLRERAAEAGLTVSSYLRSCAFEAEALRAQVKEALAELKSGAVRGSEGPSEQGNKELKERGNSKIRLARVLGHIGHLWIGLSSGKSS